MTNKDYVKLATVISEIEDKVQRKRITWVLGDMLEKDNIGFDWNTWLQVCGVT